MKWAFWILKYRKLFVFNVVIGSLLMVFLSLYIGLFMEKYQPELHQSMVQLLCSDNEKAVSVTQTYHLPGEIRVNQKVVCINESGGQTVINEFKTFLLLGLLIPLLVTVLICFLLSWFFKNSLYPD